MSLLCYAFRITGGIMDLIKILAARVKQRRECLGLSQTALAEQTGIPLPNLNRIEHGRQSIYIERLRELAKALNVSADYLIGLSDDPTPLKKRPRPRKTAAVG
jgi:transcriptional regulator with XRE-family HTH domain